MAFVTPKNVFSPLTNKTVLFLWIFIALLFAVMRSSGAKLSIKNVQQKNPIATEPRTATLAPQAARAPAPKLDTKSDSYLPFGFNDLNKRETQPKKPATKNDSLNDLLQQLE